MNILPGKSYLQLKNLISNMTEQKINYKKSVDLLNTNDKWTENRIQRKATFIIATKHIQYLGVPKPSMWKACMTKISICWRQKLKKDIRRWNGLPFSWISRINEVKIEILAKEIYRFNLIPIKMPIHFFTYLEKIWLNMQNQKIQNI